MKKFLKYSAAVLAAIVAIACNRQIETDTPQTDSGTLTFRAVLQQPDTKADLNADYAVVWQEGDQIAVFNGTEWVTSAALAAADIQNNGRYAEFSVNIDAASTYWAVYPASSAPSAAITGDDIPVTLPAVQTIVSGNSVAKDALVQVCKTDDKDNMVFQNVTSLVEFTAPEAVEGYVCFEAFGEGDAALSIAGAATVNAETPAAVTGDAARVLVKGSFTAGQNYFAVIYPQGSVSKFRFAFSKEDSVNGTMKAFRTGSTGRTIEFPLNGGKKISDLGTLAWLGPLSTKKDLDKWAKYADYYLSDETVKLGADIDYDGGNWTPVDSDDATGFAGVFDGAGYCIYNIVLGCSGEYGGLFSTIESAEPRLRVKDLTLGKKDDGSSLVVNSASVRYAGALASYIKNVTLSNVKNYIPITVKKTKAGSYFGGLVGQIMASSENSVTDCHNYGNVSFDCNVAGNDYYGGIVGLISGKTAISGCTNSGKVSRNTASSNTGVNCFGGIAGRTGNSLAGVTITDCTNYGIIETTVNIKASQLYFGGIIGMDGTSTSEAEYNLKVQNCTNEGSINGYNQSSASYAAAGGIIGRMSYESDSPGLHNAQIIGCTNLGAVTKTGNHSIEGCYGGIAGIISDVPCLIKDCVNGAADDDTKGIVTDAVQTSSKNLRLGGIVGFALRGNIENCTNYALVQSKSSVTKVYVGGIAGNSTIGKIKYCASYGDVTAENSADNTRTAGGIIGLQNGSATENFSGEGCIVQCNVSSGVPGDAGLVVGRFSNSVTAVWGSSTEPVVIKAGSTVNGVAATATNYESLLAGSNYNITASGVASGLNTIWAVFQ